MANSKKARIVCDTANAQIGSRRSLTDEDQAVENVPVLKRSKLDDGSGNNTNVDLSDNEHPAADICEKRVLLSPDSTHAAESAEKSFSEDKTLATSDRGQDTSESAGNKAIYCDKDTSSVRKDSNSLHETVVDQKVSETGCTPSSLSLSRSSGATFVSIFGKKEKKGEIDGPHLEDFDILRVKELPLECQVTNVSLQDECLADGYKDLPPLEIGEFISWKLSAIGCGHPFFSRFWPESLPDMRIWNCIDAIQFSQCGHYVNPSQVSPLVVNARRMSPDGRNLRLYVDTVHSICVSSICVTESYLHSPPASGLAQKQLRGVLHTQEWECLTAFFCMVFFKPQLNAQLYKDSLAFVTKAADFSHQGGSAMFKRTQGNKKQMAVLPNPFVLEFEASVLVYDARERDFNIAENINALKDKLPLFEGEIPKGSFAVVGYTAACYHSSKDGLWHFSGNIQWAIIMGVPSVC